jgi:hypothetical protein
MNAVAPESDFGFCSHSFRLLGAHFTFDQHPCEHLARGRLAAISSGDPSRCRARAHMGRCILHTREHRCLVLGSALAGRAVAHLLSGRGHCIEGEVQIENRFIGLCNRLSSLHFHPF